MSNQTDLTEKIAKIKLHNDIVEVVEQYVELSKKGRNYRGLCPFHDDSDPSLIVSPDKQIVHCFVCLEKALDVIGFVQKIENISFPEAISKLSGEEIKRENTFNSDNLKNRLNKITTKHNSLDIVPLPEGCIELDSIEKCPQYLLDRVNIDTIKKFKLKKIESVGGNFDNRIIIPICEEGEVKGFVGRDYTSNSDLRYLFPTDWKKDNYMFNWDNIDPTKRIIIVEGLFDAMSLVERGYTNTISILGTKFNIHRIKKMIAKGVKEIILCLDMDLESKAGQEATKKIASQINNIFKVYNAELPIGKDPDECSADELYKVFSSLKSFTLPLEL